jgi:putative membrane protein
MNSMTGALPEEQQINQLSTGTAELAQNFQQLHEGIQRVTEGAQYLTVGLDLMLTELPGTAPAIGGSAAGLAHSVSPQLEIEDAVANYGSGFAPNIIPLALWLGAGVAAFLIHVRLQPRLAKRFSRRALVSGKVFVPSVLVLIQAALIFSIVRFVLNIAVQNPAALALTLACSALTFMLIVFALTRALGDAGKALAMLFLALQISASGGFIPVELTGSVYSEISPWLPMTWVVKSIKASMFGAYESNWQSPLMIVAAWGICAFAFATLVGRWRFVASRSMRPTMEL